MSALASITLGYGDKVIAKQVKKQLKSGVSLSLPTILESEVAEFITELVPSAEVASLRKEWKRCHFCGNKISQSAHRKRPRDCVWLSRLAGLVHRFHN